MDVSVHVASFEFPGGPASIPEVLTALAAGAEEAGCSSVTLMDHYFQMEGMYPVNDAMLEGYATLGFLAAVTKRVRLGLLVTGVSYRHPGLLAKIIATLSVLSGGRVDLGIGAGWYEREHVGLGVPFAPLAERYERLEETLLICEQMWSGEVAPFHGRYYELAETLCVPPPIGRPRVIIGGDGERRTLPLVARYADACNLFAAEPATVAHKLSVLTEHCKVIGREPEAVARTIISVDPALNEGRIDDFVADMAAYARIGVQQVSVIPDQNRPFEWIDQLDELVDRLRQLPS